MVAGRRISFAATDSGNFVFPQNSHYSQDMAALSADVQILDPILSRFRRELDTIYGDRIDRIVLFGSRARGDGQADSDYDIAIFLHGFSDRWREMDKLVPLVTDIIEQTGAVIHPLPYGAGAWRERTPLMHEVRRDGVDL